MDNINTANFGPALGRIANQGTSRLTNTNNSPSSAGDPSSPVDDSYLSNKPFFPTSKKVFHQPGKKTDTESPGFLKTLWFGEMDNEQKKQWWRDHGAIQLDGDSPFADIFNVFSRLNMSVAQGLTVGIAEAFNMPQDIYNLFQKDDIEGKGVLGDEFTKWMSGHYEMERQDGLGYNLSLDMTTFMSNFAPIFRATKGTRQAIATIQTAKRLGPKAANKIRWFVSNPKRWDKYIDPTLAAALASMTSFNADEPNLATFLSSLKFEKTREWIATQDPNDPKVNALKNTIDKIGWGVSKVLAAVATKPEDEPMLNRTRNIFESLVFDLAIIGGPAMAKLIAAPIVHQYKVLQNHFWPDRAGSHSAKIKKAKDDMHDAWKHENTEVIDARTRVDDYFNKRRAELADQIYHEKAYELGHPEVEPPPPKSSKEVDEEAFEKILVDIGTLGREAKIEAENILEDISLYKDVESFIGAYRQAMSYYEEIGRAKGKARAKSGVRFLYQMHIAYRDKVPVTARILDDFQLKAIYDAVEAEMVLTGNPLTLSEMDDVATHALETRKKGMETVSESKIETRKEVTGLDKKTLLFNETTAKRYLEEWKGTWDETTLFGGLPVPSTKDFRLLYVAGFKLEKATMSAAEFIKAMGEAGYNLSAVQAENILKHVRAVRGRLTEYDLHKRLEKEFNINSKHAATIMMAASDHLKAETTRATAAPVHSVAAKTTETPSPIAGQHNLNSEFGVPEYGLLRYPMETKNTRATDPPVLRGETKVTEVDRFDVKFARDNPDSQILFGDNLEGFGKMGQAIIRDEPNAIGIPTKKFPGNKANDFFSDKDFSQAKIKIDEAFNRIDRTKNIILPKDGLGTGLAKLETKAPKIFKYLQSKIDELKGTKAALSDEKQLQPIIQERSSEAPKQEARDLTDEDGPISSLFSTVKIVNGVKAVNTAVKKGEGISTLRLAESNSNEHFGNPWKVNSARTNVPEVVKKFKDWLYGKAHHDIEPARREWIIDQIKNEGAGTKSQFLYYTKISEAEGGKSHADVLQEYANSIKQAGSPVLRGGGAEGSDTLFHQAATEHGIASHQYIAGSHPNKTPLQNESIQLSAAELKSGEDAMKTAAENLGRSWSTSKTIQDLILRNYYQVSESNQIIGFGETTKKLAGREGFSLKDIKGGTAYAFQAGIDGGIKNAHFFDISTSKWYRWDADQKLFVESTDIPVLERDFAGIGTRAQGSNYKPDTGKREIIAKEIKKIFEKHKTNGNQYKDSPYFKKKRTKDALMDPSLEPYDIWYGTRTNPELSNLEPRQFKIKVKELDGVEKSFHSVEHAYQTLKSEDWHQPTYDIYNKHPEGGKHAVKNAPKASSKTSEILMKRLIKASLDQNPKIKKVLTDTGARPITHINEGGKWGDIFPRILMEIREEYRSGIANVGESSRLQAGLLSFHDKPIRGTKETGVDEAGIPITRGTVDIKRTGDYTRPQTKTDRGFKPNVVVIETKNIKGKDGRPLAAKTDLNTKKIFIDPAEIQRTFNDKAWTKPKVKGVKPMEKEAFKNVEEWKAFLIEHEKMHLIPKINNRYKGAAKENYINELAYKALRGQFKASRHRQHLKETSDVLDKWIDLQPKDSMARVLAPSDTGEIIVGKGTAFISSQVSGEEVMHFQVSHLPKKERKQTVEEAFIRLVPGQEHTGAKGLIASTRQRAFKKFTEMLENPNSPLYLKEGKEIIKKLLKYYQDKYGPRASNKPPDYKTLKHTRLKEINDDLYALFGGKEGIVKYEELVKRYKNFSDLFDAGHPKGKHLLEILLAGNRLDIVYEKVKSKERLSKGKERLSMREMNEMRRLDTELYGLLYDRNVESKTRFYDVETGSVKITSDWKEGLDSYISNALRFTDETFDSLGLTVRESFHVIRPAGLFRAERARQIFPRKKGFAFHEMINNRIVPTKKIEFLKAPFDSRVSGFYIKKTKNPSAYRKYIENSGEGEVFDVDIHVLDKNKNITKISTEIYKETVFRPRKEKVSAYERIADPDGLDQTYLQKEAEQLKSDNLYNEDYHTTQYNRDFSEYTVYREIRPNGTDRILGKTATGAKKALDALYNKKYSIKNLKEHLDNNYSIREDSRGKKKGVFFYGKQMETEKLVELHTRQKEIQQILGGVEGIPVKKGHSSWMKPVSEKYTEFLEFLYREYEKIPSHDRCSF